MGSATKVTLMLVLVSAMVMAAQAGTKYVTCKNDYCQLITLNGVEVDVGATVTIAVDDGVGEIVCEVTNAVGELVSGTYTCPSSVTSLSFLGTVEGLVCEVVGGTVATLLGLITVVIDAALNLIICL